MPVKHRVDDSRNRPKSSPHKTAKRLEKKERMLEIKKMKPSDRKKILNQKKQNS